MTREETKSCIGTIKMLQRLAYNIHGVMDVIDADNCKKIIKALEQEPCEDALSPTVDPVGLEEAKKLIYQEWKSKVEEDNPNQRLLVAYQIAMKALEQEPILDKIRAEIERQQKWLMDAGYNAYNVDIALDAIKSVVKESEDKE